MIAKIVCEDGECDLGDVLYSTEYAAVVRMTDIDTLIRLEKKLEPGTKENPYVPSAGGIIYTWYTASPWEQSYADLKASCRLEYD